MSGTCRLTMRHGAGISPLVRAGVTAGQLANIEKSLSMDAQPPSGLYIPLPSGSSSKTVASAKTAVTDGKGGLTLVEAPGAAMGGTGTPKSNMEQIRYGPLIPPSSIDLRDKSAQWVLAAAGIPPSLFTSQGAALRESYRHFFTKTIEPIGAIMQDELSDKLEVDFRVLLSRRCEVRH